MILLTTAALVLAACSPERAVTVTQPQKSALTHCYNEPCAAPLLVVDGQQVDFNATNLDPHDIAQIEILKGDGAVAKYGEAARRGVVIVTSKKSRPPR